jgi:hypothetical protein
MPSTKPARIRRTALAVGLGALMVTTIAGPLHAQSDDSSASALASVEEARDAANARIDEIQDSVEEACQAMVEEACQVRIVAVELPAIADELSTYADIVEGLDLPETFLADAETLVAGLRAEADLVDASVVASESADGPALQMAFDARVAAAADLASQLDPEWARAAFTTSLGGSTSLEILSFAGDTTEEERAYLAAVREIPQAAAEDFACFGGAISRTYTSTDDLLAALVECNAGEAVAKNAAAARGIVPPERFTDEHAWLLAGYEESTRLDRLIGEAAAEGDIAKFIANNARLGIAFRSTPDLDPAFVRGGDFGPVLDPTARIAGTDYGRGLFAVMLDYSTVNPVRMAVSAIGFPQVPRAEGLPAAVDLAPELRAYDDELRAALSLLQPPPELAADHALIVDFFETESRQFLEDFIGAAEAGDVALTYELESAGDDAYCAVASALSEEIRPAVDPYFEPNDQICG